MNEICLKAIVEKVHSSFREKQQTLIKSREDLTSVRVTLILWVTHYAKRNGRWDVLKRERKEKTARTFQVWQPC